MGQKILVRNYCADDLEFVKEILSEYLSPTGKAWSKSLVEEMISDALKEQPDGVFVAEMNEEVVGFAIIMFQHWLGIAYLDYIQVKTECFGKGVGHKLIEKCIKWAKEKGARIVYTETGRNNEIAIKFYQKHGFQITGYIPDYYKKGLDAVILVNKID
jgi:ribosomal protein S18 acetylase RimI-like enzyme